MAPGRCLPRRSTVQARRIAGLTALRISNKTLQLGVWHSPPVVRRAVRTRTNRQAASHARGRCALAQSQAAYARESPRCEVSPPASPGARPWNRTEACSHASPPLGEKHFSEKDCLTTSIISSSVPIQPLVTAWASRLPIAVASAGPATTGRRVASAVNWHNNALREPPPTT